MANLRPTDIVDEVRKILAEANQGKSAGGYSSYLTAYQILDRLSKATRDRLIQERGMPGQGAGEHYSAASAVSDAAEMIPGINVKYLDTNGLTVDVAGTQIVPGYPVCGIYKL